MGKQLTIKQKFIIKKIALQYVRDINYLTKDYESGELNQTVRGYGPNAKNVSVLTLLRLMSAFKDKEIEDWVILLMSDNEQIVRYHALKGLKYFWNQRKTEYWNIIKNRCIVETDGMCFNEILLAVYPHEIIINDKENVEDFCLSVMERLNAYKTKIAPEIWKVLVVIILKLIIYEDSSEAKAIVYSNINVNDFCRSLIFEITKVIDPYRENNDYIEEPEKYKGLIIILLDLVKIRYEKMRIKNLDQDSKYDDFKIIDHLIQQLYYTVCHGKVSNKDRSISANHKLAFYKKIKPLISCIVEQSVILHNGYMVAHTGYYFIQMLNDLFELDPEDILDFSNKIVLCSSKSGFTSDRTTLGEIIKLTELIITDYKEILYKKNNFSNLISILDHFSNSGWQEAMEMTWRLKEAF
ncbi:hypothetical protein [Chryseobacterium sp. 3008163]|uniref:hypothetical protein n=1 Tax=Chryseobacterium sp. 3008163 TaxID=2478663 RepID=UPI000F0CB0AE|nr:hypothetical protein [Chryseobacterium sp. 3008163]AYM99182.1 hypothetical protein EAG08_01450 [Chryseobacterium sp. 3008163]